MAKRRSRKKGNLLWRIWQWGELLIEYAVNTLIAVAIFAVFVGASRVTRWLNTIMITSEDISKPTFVFRFIEWLILISGALLCTIFIVRNTHEFIGVLAPDLWQWIKNLWRRIAGLWQRMTVLRQKIFAKRSQRKEGSE